LGKTILESGMHSEGEAIPPGIGGVGKTFISVLIANIVRKAAKGNDVVKIKVTISDLMLQVLPFLNAVTLEYDCSWLCEVCPPYGVYLMNVPVTRYIGVKSIIHTQKLLSRFSDRSLAGLTSGVNKTVPLNGMPVRL